MTLRQYPSGRHSRGHSLSLSRGALALRAFATVLVAIGVFPLANVMTDGRAVPWYSGAAQEWLERGMLMVAVLLVVARYFGPWVDGVIERWKALILRPSSLAFGASMSLLAVVAAAVVSQIAFAGQPFTSDEMAQAWHARILASGHLFAVAETPREFFNTAPVLDTGGRWFSQYPIGGPALIAVGVLLGAAWLVNPILLGVATFALSRSFVATTGELRARLATLLFVASPMVLQMAGSQMNHVPALTFAILALWGLTCWDAAETSRKRMTTAALTGLGIGAVAMVRPLDAALVALVLGAVQVARAVKEPARWASIGVQAAAGALTVAMLLWANAQTTGSPLMFGYDALNGPSHGLGFHVDPNGDPHTLQRGLVFTSGYLLKLSLFLFEWPLPGVLVIAVGLAAIRKPTRWDALMAGMFAAFLVAYAAYWFDGFFAGPRFLFGAVPAFIYFVVRVPDIAGAAPHPVVRRALSLVVPLCVVVAWLGPWGVSSASSRIDLYRDQRTKLKTPIEHDMRSAGIQNALVFVTEGWRGELLAQLRVMGASQFLANRLGTTLDACALQTAIDAEPRSTEPASERLARIVAKAEAAGVARPVPNLSGDLAISLVPGSLPTRRCLAAFARDSMGTMPYAMFLARQTVGADGRVGGAVVFVRDMGERNEELRARFGNRTWYRYRPAVPPATAAAFLPYR